MQKEDDGCEKKGAVTKHLNKIQEALLTGGELEGDDAEMVASVDQKNLLQARASVRDSFASCSRRLRPTRGRTSFASLPTISA